MSRYLVTGGSGFIGTHVIESLRRSGLETLNVDIAAPKLPEHHGHWKQQDILDPRGLARVVSEFAPTHVIHLAARTDTLGTELHEYRTNTEGTQNVLDAIIAAGSTKRLIVTSTQFVHQADRMPEGDQDFAPHTVYGESKVVSERMTRDAPLECTWTIIRPTNIWGPWHLRYPHEFWRVLAQGRYLHPGREPVTRSYGYVGNVAWQIRRLWDASVDLVDRRVLYVGDEPMDLLAWVDGFSRAQLGRNVRVVPRAIVRMLATVGDVATRAGIRFPLTTSRFLSMVTNNPAPMRATFDAIGRPPHTLEEGIAETVVWMRKYHPHLVRVESHRRV